MTEALSAASEDVAASADQALRVFETSESEVRLYCRAFPVVFVRAKGVELVAEDGRIYLDFLCGAGALNFGHNHEFLKQRLLEYLAGDGITLGLDMHTAAKRVFLTRFRETVLVPGGLDYKVQFCGPTGANAVEAALKLARKVTGRRGVVAFAGGFHGMSQGALSVSGPRVARAAAGVSLPDVTFVPYEDGPSSGFNSISYLDRMLSDESSGIAPPAAVIVEPLQMDGGVYPASRRWLQDLQELTRRHGALLICDEIQTGCGRAGAFFCFQQADIRPDLVTVAKSISGYGLPLSMLLLRPELDVWSPGEHTGTFRANQLALVTATAALELWGGPELQRALRGSSARLRSFAAQTEYEAEPIRVRAQGMAAGVDLTAAGGGRRAREVQRRCFEDGLIVELCGRGDAVVKVMPPLIIEQSDLDRGLEIIRRAIASTDQT